MSDINTQVLADKAVELTSQLSETIEQLTERGCIVSMEVWFNGGGESMALPRLNGEMNLQAGVYVSLTED